MKLRKIAAGILAAAMLASVSATALAADTSATTQTVEYAGTTEVPTIKVTVPTSGTVAVNPYGLTVTVDETEFTSQIVSPTQYIKSETNSKLDVSATVTGTPSGSAVFATASTQGGKAVTTNSVFMYLEVDNATGEDTEPVWADSYDKTNVKQLLIGASANSSKGAMVTLDAGDENATYAAFHLTGDAADQPSTAWTADDKVNVSVAFTFTPVMAEAETEPSA